MKNKCLDDQALEFLNCSVSSESKKVNLVSKLSQVWHRFLESIIAVNQLKVHSLKNKSGSLYWVIYDRFLDRRVYFNSEAEVRQWLDRRYHT